MHGDPNMKMFGTYKGREINMKNFYENAPPSNISGKIKDNAPKAKIPSSNRTHQRRWAMEPP
tara:strand:+ start:1488 stop:1673 length:186 start_codon:yes stop_codon:yes gene_type:complete